MPRKATVAVEPADLGTPGHFYFEYPQVTEIKSPKPAPYTDPRVRPQASTYGEGACRMVSCHNIHGYTPPSNLKYMLSRWPAKKDVEAYLEIHDTNGFGRGATVCRKHQPINDMDKVYKWGVILMECVFSPSTEYRPYLVKWFGDGQVEHAWAEDLFLIHARLDSDTFWGILETQEFDPIKGEAT